MNLDRTLDSTSTAAGRRAPRSVRLATTAALLALAAPALGVAAGPASAAGRVAWMYDINEDGRVDASTVDSNRDGILDRNLVDANRDRYGETWLLDVNQDGRMDNMHMDTNFDRRMDFCAYDYNQDAVLDGKYSCSRGGPVTTTTRVSGGRTIPYRYTPSPYEGGASIGAGLTRLGNISSAWAR